MQNQRVHMSHNAKVILKIHQKLFKHFRSMGSVKLSQFNVASPMSLVGGAEDI